MGFFLPQRQVIYIHDLCCGIFSLVCMVVLLAWQEAWKTLHNLDIFFFNRMGEEVGKDLVTLCKPTGNLSTKPPVLPYLDVL